MGEGFNNGLSDDDTDDSKTDLQSIFYPSGTRNLSLASTVEDVG